MRRRNTITAVVFLLAVAAGFVLLLTSFFGGEGKFETLLKSFVRERDVMAFPISWMTCTTPIPPVPT